MRSHFAVLLLVACAASAAFAQDPAADPVKKATEHPTSTGLLVTEIAPDGQAGSVGIALGDIIVSYDGKPTLDVDALKAAVAGAKGDGIAVGLDRFGEAKTVQVKAGRIGVGLVPVKKGERFDPLPPATDVKFDFSRIEKAGEAWYAFSPDGVKKIGFEHYRWKADQGNLVLDSEVAFDGGKEWGLNHFVVTVVVAKGDALRGQSYRFESPIAHAVLEGHRVVDPQSPIAIWETKAKAADGQEETHREPAAGDVIPTYFIYALARCMPQTQGACYRFTPVEEGSGKVGKPCALYVEGQEPSKVGDREVPTWKIQWVSMVGVMNTHWVDAEGNVVRTDYGRERGAATTKEEALKDLHPDLHPQMGN